jgi:subtilisin family serine protease
MGRRWTILVLIALLALPMTALATEYKATTEINGHLAAADSVIVSMEDGVELAVMAGAMAAEGMAVRSVGLEDGVVVERDDLKAVDVYTSEEIFVVTVDVTPKRDLAEQIAALETLPGVREVSPNYIHFPSYRPNDSYYSSYQGNFRQLYLEDAWDLTKGSGATVAVIDSGYRTTGMSDSATNIGGGYDFWGNDGNVNDYIGHGTHVGNTVAEATNNSRGCAGIAFQARLMPLKVFPDYDGGALESDIISAINYARSNGADVINMSLGGGGYVSQSNSAINNAFNSDVVVVAASGNDGASSVDYPGAYENAIGVGSCNTHSLGANPQRSSFSNYGSALDLVAPGDEIVQETYEPGYGAGYYALGGTSMAAPHVAGVAALLVSYGGADAAAIRNALYQTARSSSSTWTNQLGWGEVDAHAALVAYGGGGGGGNDKPIADADASPRLGDAPLTVVFDGGGSSDPDGSIASYRWKIVADGDVIGSSKTVTHTFTSPGQYVVELRVNDDEGAYDTDTVTISVTGEGDDDDDDDTTFDDSDCGLMLSTVYDDCGFAFAYANGQEVLPSPALQMCDENESDAPWDCLLQCYDSVDACGTWRACARQECGVRVLESSSGASSDGENDFMWGCGE